MKVVFMGSPEFAVPALRALIDHHEVALVVTQPDKRVGRGKRMAPPPVKEVAVAAGIPVAQPKSARDREFAAALRATGAEIGVVVAYGKILPRRVLEAFPRGCINIHGSLLPRYRGAAPIQWAIIRGETETGVTIMQLDRGMDTGPMLLSRSMPVLPDDTAGSLFQRMAPVGAEALLDALDGLEQGTLEPIAQDHDAASYAPMLEKTDGIIDWTQTAREVANRIRGVDPWPGAETRMGEMRLKLYGARAMDNTGDSDTDSDAQAQPGQVLGVDRDGLRVACGQGVCVIAALQAPGRRRLLAKAFVSGRPIPVGTVLTGPAPTPGETAPSA
jgi:methionyl-tRNA formyltransferase